MILADIHTSNPDRHDKNWGVIIKDNIAQLTPNFDYDYTFSQNEYAMQGLAEAVENKDKSVLRKVKQKYNIKRFTEYLKTTTQNIGLETGEGRQIFVDIDVKKYSFKETAKYIEKELGEKEYAELVSKVDIQEALPQVENKDYEIYSLLAKLHSYSAKEKITNPKDIEQER